MTDHDSDPADQTVFLLDAKAWEAFMTALEAPARTHPRMAALLASKAPWDDDADQPAPSIPSLDTYTP